MALDQCKALADAGYLAAAIDLLNTHDDMAESLKASTDLMIHLYWQKKDLPAAVAVGQAAMDRLQKAEEAILQSREAFDVWQHYLKAITYNLASFCWPGWREEGIAIGAAELKTGRQAAMKHYTIVRQLAPEALVLARAAWIAGAHELSATHYVEAVTLFNESADHAQQADNTAEALLARGFSAMAEGLQDGADRQASRDRLAAVKRELASLENGGNFVSQLDTAEAVFTPVADDAD